MIEPKRFVADFAVALKKFSPFATSDKISMPSTAPRAKTPNLGVLVKALAVNVPQILPSKTFAFM